MVESMVLKDAAELKAVADPLRLRLLMAFERPRTVKAAAEQIGVPVTRLYYHVAILEEHGLVRVVSRRQVSGIEERTYQSTSTGWSVSEELVSSLESSGLLSALFDLVHAELAVALDNGFEGRLLGINRLALSPEEREELESGLVALVERFACLELPPPPGKEIYHLFLVGYPLFSGGTGAARG